MKEIFLSIWMGVVSFFGYTDVTQDEMNAEVEQRAEAPSGNPGVTAPVGAYTSCLDQPVDTACIYQIGGEQFDGVCHNIMGKATCGPDNKAPVPEENT